MDIELTTNKLYNAIIQESKKVLNDSQKEKLYYACEKSIRENPELDFNDWKTAANIYLNFIIDFPLIDLGPIVENKDSI